MEVDRIYCKCLLILSVITQVGVTWAGFQKPATLNLASFLTMMPALTLSLQLSEGYTLDFLFLLFVVSMLALKLYFGSSCRYTATYLALTLDLLD